MLQVKSSYKLGKEAKKAPKKVVKKPKSAAKPKSAKKATKVCTHYHANI